MGPPRRRVGRKPHWSDACKRQSLGLAQRVETLACPQQVRITPAQQGILSPKMKTRKANQTQLANPLDQSRTGSGVGLEQYWNRLWRRVGLVAVHSGRGSGQIVQWTPGKMAAACGVHAAQGPFDGPAVAGKRADHARGGHYACRLLAPGQGVLADIGWGGGCLGGRYLGRGWFFIDELFSTSGRHDSRGQLFACRSDISAYGSAPSSRWLAFFVVRQAGAQFQRGDTLARPSIKSLVAFAFFHRDSVIFDVDGLALGCVKLFVRFHCP